MKILMVLTSHITLAPPKGGQPPLDPKSEEADSQTAATDRFRADEETQVTLAHTVRLADVNPASSEEVARAVLALL